MRAPRIAPANDLSTALLPQLPLQVAAAADARKSEPQQPNADFQTVLQTGAELRRTPSGAELRRTRSVEPVDIERRAVSPAFLRAFTKTKVHGQPGLVSEAVKAAASYYTSQIKATRERLKALQEPHPDFEALRSKLADLEFDLDARKESKYMTTRDVHKYIIKPETDGPPAFSSPRLLSCARVRGA